MYQKERYINLKNGCTRNFSTSLNVHKCLHCRISINSLPVHIFIVPTIHYKQSLSYQTIAILKEIMNNEDKLEYRSTSLTHVQMQNINKSGNAFQKVRKMDENIYYNTYSDTNRRWTGIASLLCRWKQSVFKLIWHNVILFLTGYFTLSILYRCILFHYPSYKQTFEIVCIYADNFNSSIPITFLIGFYVSQVVSRWWDQFMTLPYPDVLALKLVAFIPGRVS